jgi:hypothetical protein
MCKVRVDTRARAATARICTASVPPSRAKAAARIRSRGLAEVVITDRIL